MIYFDAAATSFQKPPAVREAVRSSMEHYASPGRGGYRPAMEAAEAVYHCRELAGQLFEVEKDQVVFAFNTTHALNMAIKSLVHTGDRVVVSGFEHNAVMRPLTAIGAQIIVAGRRLFDWDDTLQSFERALTKDTKAAVVTHVSNVFGYELPLAQIADLCRKNNVPLIVDAAQSAGICRVSMEQLGAEFIAMPGHKGLYGPQGTGMLLCRRVPEQTILEGGTGSVSRLYTMPDFLPDRLEAGTQNVPGICGLSEGIAFVMRQGTDEIREHETRLLRQTAEGIRNLPGIHCETGAHQVGVLSFTGAGYDCEELAGQLAEREICVRAGLHCAPLSHESAGGGGTVRVSFSSFNTTEEVQKFCAVMEEICAASGAQSVSSPCHLKEIIV